MQNSMAKMRSGTIPIGETEAELRVGERPGAEHTPVEQRVIDEYQNFTDTAPVDFVQRAAQNPGGKERYTLNPVSERAAADIKKLPALIQPVIRRFLNSVWQSTFFGGTAKLAR